MADDHFEFVCMLESVLRQTIRTLFISDANIEYRACVDNVIITMRVHPPVLSQ